MTGLVNATFQLNLGQKTADDVWLAWFLEAFQQDPEANDADDAWLG